MITKEQLKHLAELAKIEFSEEELEKFLSDLNRILRYIDEIKELDLSRFEPMVGGPVQKLELREDKIENYDKEKKDMIVNQFPQKENNYLRAPKIISKS